MLEVSRRIRLVAPRLTPVLIEGPTGSGKELVAEALHRLSPRSRKPFVAINCAAIPEALLEAELFGHTRGAFTGAVQGRVGRIEAADGGTLFLDEIGEMPLALQSKLLRFVECGELQRVGDNETVKVDVRIIAATHRPLAQQAQSGTFRSDLYYRLAVFLIRTPALAEHAEDLPLLVEHFMQKLGRDTPVKRVERGALAKLAAHDWPGNVRELEHVLERGVILAGDDPVLTAREIDFGLVGELTLPAVAGKPSGIGGRQKEEQHAHEHWRLKRGLSDQIARYLDLATSEAKADRGQHGQHGHAWLPPVGMDFEAEMREAMDGVDQGEPPRTVRVQPVDGLIARPDGNNVSMDRESLNLAEAQLKFKTGVALLHAGVSARDGRDSRRQVAPRTGQSAQDEHERAEFDGKGDQRDESVWIDGNLGQAMQAERMRAEVVAANMANAETTRTATGGPYRRQDVVFAADRGDPGFWIP